MEVTLGRRGWVERPQPWWSEAFAAGGAFLAGGGLLALGLDLSKDWAIVLVGTYVAMAYLVEPFLPRVGQAACTTSVALGTPTFVALVVLPTHTYNGFRVIQIATILLWLAFFALGGTRGRMVLLALAMTFMWLFVTLEVGHVQQTARYITPFGIGAFVTPSIGSSETCTAVPLGSSQEPVCTRSGQIYAPTDGFPEPSRKSPTDYALGIGLESLAFGALFLLAIRRGERTGRRGIATAYVIPAALSLSLGVVALGDKLDHPWIAGVLALLIGLGVGLVANGSRRFLTWTGAIGSVIGVALIAGDIADSLWGGHREEFRYVGLTFFVFGLATIFAAVMAARLLGEQEAAPALTEP